MICLLQLLSEMDLKAEFRRMAAAKIQVNEVIGLYADQEQMDKARNHAEPRNGTFKAIPLQFTSNRPTWTLKVVQTMAQRLANRPLFHMAVSINSSNGPLNSIGNLYMTDLVLRLSEVLYWLLMTGLQV